MEEEKTIQTQSEKTRSENSADQAVEPTKQKYKTEQSLEGGEGPSKNKTHSEQLAEEEKKYATVTEFTERELIEDLLIQGFEEEENSNNIPRTIQRDLPAVLPKSKPGQKGNNTKLTKINLSKYKKITLKKKKSDEENSPMLQRWKGSRRIQMTQSSLPESPTNRERNQNTRVVPKRCFKTIKIVRSVTTESGVIAERKEGLKIKNKKKRNNGSKADSAAWKGFPKYQDHQRERKELRQQRQQRQIVFLKRSERYQLETDVLEDERRAQKTDHHQNIRTRHEIQQKPLKPKEVTPSRKGIIFGSGIVKSPKFVTISSKRLEFSPAVTGSLRMPSSVIIKPLSTKGSDKKMIFCKKRSPHKMKNIRVVAKIQNPKRQIATSKEERSIPQTHIDSHKLIKVHKSLNQRSADSGDQIRKEGNLNAGIRRRAVVGGSSTTQLVKRRRKFNKNLLFFQNEKKAFEQPQASIITQKKLTGKAQKPEGQDKLLRKSQTQRESPGKPDNKNIELTRRLAFKQRKFQSVEPVQYVQPRKKISVVVPSFQKPKSIAISHNKNEKQEELRSNFYGSSQQEISSRVRTKTKNSIFKRPKSLRSTLIKFDSEPHRLVNGYQREGKSVHGWSEEARKRIIFKNLGNSEILKQPPTETEKRNFIKVKHLLMDFKHPGVYMPRKNFFEKKKNSQRESSQEKSLEKKLFTRTSLVLFTCEDNDQKPQKKRPKPGYSEKMVEYSRNEDYMNTSRQLQTSQSKRMKAHKEALMQGNEESKESLDLGLKVVSYENMSIMAKKSSRKSTKKSSYKAFLVNQINSNQAKYLNNNQNLSSRLMAKLDSSSSKRLKTDHDNTNKDSDAGSSPFLANQKLFSKTLKNPSPMKALRREIEAHPLVTESPQKQQNRFAMIATKGAESTGRYRRQYSVRGDPNQISRNKLRSKSLKNDFQIIRRTRSHRVLERGQNQKQAAPGAGEKSRGVRVNLAPRFASTTAIEDSGSRSKLINKVSGIRRSESQNQAQIGL